MPVNGWNISRQAHREIKVVLRNHQNSKCAICDKLIGDNGHLDHHHEKEYCRGVLCQSCNLGIGYFKDSMRLLSRAAIYVAFYEKMHKEYGI